MQVSRTPTTSRICSVPNPVANLAAWLTVLPAERPGGYACETQEVCLRVAPGPAIPGSIRRPVDELA
jgi:hypothetical protein